MTVTVKHSKTNAISDWTQAQLDEQIALGNFAEGTVLADIVLPSDWNNDHTFTGTLDVSNGGTGATTLTGYVKGSGTSAFTASSTIPNTDISGLGTISTQNANSVAITGGTINNTSIGATTASTGKFTSVTTPSVTASSTDLTLSAISTGAVKFNTLNGEQVRISDATVTGQYTSFSRNAGQNIQLIGAMGTANLGLYATGGGVIRFLTASDLTKEQFRVADTASAVNYVQVTGGATGSGPFITAQGSDTNIPLNISGKGGSGIAFYQNGSGTPRMVQMQTQAGAVNYHTFTPSLTNNAPVYAVDGTDTNISMGIRPKGTGAINLAAGSSGVNISNGGTVTAITRTNNSGTYTSVPTVAISAPTTAGGVQATVSVTTMVQSGSSPTINGGGTGYTVGDVLTIVGGTPLSIAATMTVTTVSSGVITGINYTNFASYTALPTNPFSVTGGTGTGATFTSTWYPNTFTITNAGSGYIEQPTITFSGGGGSGASAYATVGGTTIVRGLGTNIDFYVPSSIASASPALRIADGGSSTIYPQINNFGSTVNILAAGATNTQLLLGSNGTSPITLSTNGASRVEQLRVSHTASAVNYVQVTGGSTTNNGQISTVGSDTNVGLTLQTKGTGSYAFITGGGRQVDILNVASAVNRMTLVGSATGSAPTMSVVGTDTNIDLSLTTKGTGAVRFNTGGGEQFRVADTFAGGTATNYIQVQGRASFQPVLSTAGASTNIPLQISTKGTGDFSVWTNGGAQQQFSVTHTASAVNYVQVTGSATGGGVTIIPAGSDANILLALNSKGTNPIQCFTNGSRQFQVSNTTSAANFLQVTGAIASSAPILSAQGSDTNIDLTLTPKGTGLVRFGTYTAGALLATGYINIKAADGTTYKVLVST